MLHTNTRENRKKTSNPARKRYKQLLYIFTMRRRTWGVCFNKAKQEVVPYFISSLRMNLTPLQLQIQQRTDKTLSPNCMIKQDTIAFIVPSIDKEKSGLITILRNGVLLVASEQMIELNKTIEIIWHPMNWGRLSYLYLRNRNYEWVKDEFNKLKSAFWFYEHKYIQQTVLERPVELQELVLSFLNTLWPL